MSFYVIFYIHQLASQLLINFTLVKKKLISPNISYLINGLYN